MKEKYIDLITQFSCLLLTWLFRNEDIKGSVWQMQILQEITERAALTKKKW